MDERLLLRFGSFTVAVVSPDARVRERLRLYFRPFASLPPDGSPADVTLQVALGEPLAPPVPLRPWDAKGKESFADVGRRRLVRKDRTGAMIVVQDGRWSITGDVQRRFSQVVNLIGTAYGVSLLDSGGTMLHASAVVRDRQALAVVGQSGSGKSSVAVRLLERGFDFLTNDRLIVLPAGRGVTAHGLPKLPRVNPGTLLASERTRALVEAGARRRYERLSKDELWRVEDKYDLDVGAALGRRWVLSTPLAAALVLEWRAAGSGLSIERLDAGRALEALRPAAKSFGPFDLRLAERSDAALQVLARRVPVYRVTGARDPTALAERLAQPGWQPE
jgi:HprK-related kinase B